MKLITLLVVIAGVIALAQLAKVGQLTSLIRNKKEEDISDADTRLNGGLFIAFMVAFYASFIFLIIRCTSFHSSGMKMSLADAKALMDDFEVMDAAIAAEVDLSEMIGDYSDDDGENSGMQIASAEELEPSGFEDVDLSEMQGED